MTLLRTLLAALAVWRLTYLLQAEDGPFDAIEHGRNWLRKTWLAGLANCFYCLSLWMAAPFAFVLTPSWQDRLLLWPALSAAAIFLNRISESIPETTPYYEEPIREEKSPCPVAEGPEFNRAEMFKPIQAQFESMRPSWRQRCSGMPAARG